MLSLRRFVTPPGPCPPDAAQGAHVKKCVKDLLGAGERGPCCVREITGAEREFHGRRQKLKPVRGSIQSDASMCGGKTAVYRGPF